MTHPRNASPAGADAERAAFLRDLQALRDQAGLQTGDLAARAHYPEDTLKTAEDGPALPSLPVLEAYVRACGARPSDWEDRWRRLMFPQEAADLGSALPTRAPTANRLPTRAASAGPVGLSAAEQAALAPGLARVAAGLGPTTVTTDAGSWFSRTDATAPGPAPGPSPAAPAAPSVPAVPPGPALRPSVPSAPLGARPSTPPGARPSAPESGAAWHNPDHGSGWPADGASAWPPAGGGTAWPPATERNPVRPAPAESGPAWADSGTPWPPAERGPITGPSRRPAESATPPSAARPATTERAAAPSGASGSHGRPRKSTAPLDASELPAPSEPGRRPGARRMAGIMLSLAALLAVTALLWLALAS